jgi:hypothetical protein
MHLTKHGPWGFVLGWFQAALALSTSVSMHIMILLEQQCSHLTCHLCHQHDDPPTLHGCDAHLFIRRCEASVCLEALACTISPGVCASLLGRCILSDDFWPAIWSHLPGLQQLTVGRGVSGATAHELANFCSCATRVGVCVRLGTT